MLKQNSLSVRSELGKNLNTDEAPALGAVYQAAFQSKGYKVKKFYIREANIYPIVVDFEKYQGDGTAAAGSAASTVRRVLFDKLNPYPQKKVMTFGRHTTDFGFNVNYGDLDFLDQMSLKYYLHAIYYVVQFVILFSLLLLL